MDVERSQPEDDELPPAAFGSFLFFIAGFFLWMLVSDFLDPPPTWNGCDQPTTGELAELSARRDDFLRLTVPIVTVYGILLAVCAWKWAADRRARQGYERRPGWFALIATLGLGSLWVLLLNEAFVSERMSGGILIGFLLAAAGTVASIAVGLVVGTGVFRGRTSPPPGEAAESLAVGFAWWLLLVGLPFLLFRIAIVGTNATFLC
jgi:hypothetical protein